MEKIPEFRMVGGASEEEKNNEKKRVQSLLTNHVASLDVEAQKIVQHSEIPKTQEDLDLINFANQETNILRVECGMDPYDIPSENYHIVPNSVYKQGIPTGSSGVCHYGMQGILIDASKTKHSLVYFGLVTLHETIHLKGHYAMEVQQDLEKIRRNYYRAGVTVLSAQGKNSQGDVHEHFEGLHEGIVAEQEKKSYLNMMSLPLLQSENERLNTEQVQNLKARISDKRKISFDDIAWVGKNEDEFETFPYRKHREVLMYVCEEIQKQFSDSYETKDDVYKEFLKAHFTGQLLTIARLVDQTFGQGSFRLLGNMKKDSKSAVLTLETFRKLLIKHRK
jgi:hypothetical protein